MHNGCCCSWERNRCRFRMLRGTVRVSGVDETRLPMLLLLLPLPLYPLWLLLLPLLPLWLLLPMLHSAAAAAPLPAVAAAPAAANCYRMLPLTAVALSKVIVWRSCCCHFLVNLLLLLLPTLFLLRLLVSILFGKCILCCICWAAAACSQDKDAATALNAAASHGAVCWSVLLGWR